MNQQVQINIIIGIMLLLCSVKDIKKKEVSYMAVIIGSIAILLVLFTGRDIFTWSRLGGCAVGGIIMVISRVSRGQVGMGDGILLFVTGIGMGLWINVSILAYGLFFACIFSVYLLIRKKISKRDTIPFVPFLFLGYISVLMI